MTITRKLDFTDYASREQLIEEYERVCSYAGQLTEAAQRASDWYALKANSESLNLATVIAGLRAALAKNPPRAPSPSGEDARTAASGEESPGDEGSNPSARDGDGGVNNPSVERQRRTHDEYERMGFPSGWIWLPDVKMWEATPAIGNAEHKSDCDFIFRDSMPCSCGARNTEAKP